MGGRVGVKNVSKNDHPFWGLKMMNLSVLFFYSEPKTLSEFLLHAWGLYGGEWDKP